MEPAEKRGAARVSLFMRSVRVITDAAQILCILRDISATGVRLKLFHALPPTAHMAIDLGAGPLHFIEKVWEKEGHAGFRFAAPVDIAAVIGDGRSASRPPVRLELDFPAVIRGDGDARLARVVELSQHGARISCDHPFAVHEYVTLGADGFPTRSGTVEWRSSPDHGVIFQQSFALDDLARLAASLQGLPIGQPVEAAGRNSMASPFMQ